MLESAAPGAVRRRLLRRPRLVARARRRDARRPARRAARPGADARACSPTSRSPTSRSGRRPSSATSGCADWHRIEIHDELDVVGPIATGILRQHGVAVAADASPATCRSSTRCRGGSVMDGEGGDEVLGSAAHRVAPLARVRALAASGALAPRTARARCACTGIGAGAARCARQWSDRRSPWLRPRPAKRSLDALDAVRRAPAAVVRGERPSRPAPAHAGARRPQNRDGRPRRHDVRLHEPAAASRRRARAGARGRVPRVVAIAPPCCGALAADLLPTPSWPARARRRSPGATWPRTPVRFAEGWDGTGVDPELVDPEAAAPHVAGRRTDRPDRGAPAGGVAGGAADSTRQRNELQQPEVARGQTT